MELNKVKLALRQEEEACTGQRAEIDKLSAIISEADAERLRQRKEYEAVLAERDILGTQLIRRNDELALVYEKIKLQQSTISKGQLAYRCGPGPAAQSSAVRLALLPAQPAHLLPHHA